ncbi:MAG: hypothetical protein JWQ34_3157 [Mucilaginibacter sp.]|uniref:hypothetical protein n=1 Tax=Mucilaginibacter sp. TaxID=1882438 RepID=UPI00260DADA1|nr:hypothetical protein [Mucilaginibacter sp.]MDB5004932.1 hypothetical protein [Mucilaginibacter sp.]
MFNKLILTCFLVFGTLTISNAQSLKITDVNSSNDKMYKQASEGLGKAIIITIYDKSVKLQLPDDAKPIVLRAISANEYYDVTEESEKEKWTARLTVNKTLGVVTSALLTITVAEKGGKYQSASCTFTAKRF